MKKDYRTIWISDIHLGTRGCKAQFLLEFLNHIQCEKLYLVGDIIDMWRLKSGWYWPDMHNAVIRRLMNLANNGTEVIYIPGNHDSNFRGFLGVNFGEIDLDDEVIHFTADGRKLLVLHGDQFDALIIQHRWLGYVGAHLYEFVLNLNTLLNFFQRKLGLPYWSLSLYLKHKAKAATNVINNFEKVLAEAAKHKGMDGVVCGHIHKAEIRDIDGISYYNDGDWVESCTALVENHDGKMEIIKWAELRESLL